MTKEHNQPDERKQLAALLSDAVDDIEAWAGYAEPYFQEKHDLQGTIKRYRGALAKLDIPEVAVQICQCCKGTGCDPADSMIACPQCAGTMAQPPAPADAQTIAEMAEEEKRLFPERYAQPTTPEPVQAEPAHLRIILTLFMEYERHCTEENDVASLMVYGDLRNYCYRLWYGTDAHKHPLSEKLEPVAWFRKRYVDTARMVYEGVKEAQSCLDYIDALIDNEKKPAPASVVPQWQPIATAPKDGTNRLLYLSTGIVFQAYWEPQESAWVGAICGLRYFEDQWPFTHWMPLPAAPKQGER